MPDRRVYLSHRTPTENLYLAIFRVLPKHDIDEEDLPELINILKTLSPREADVTTRYYRLSYFEDPYDDQSDFRIAYARTTLEEIGNIYNVKGERTRQIKERALRKLRHPVRSNKIKALFASRAEESPL